MNERIREFLKQCEFENYDWNGTLIEVGFDAEKFAELIVQECKENFAKVWYEQGLDVRGAELNKFMLQFNEHFGIER
jgi:hypothetical protein